MASADTPRDGPAPIVTSDAIRRAAQLYVASFLLGLAGLMIAVGFESGPVETFSSLIIPLGEIPLVLRLRAVVAARPTWLPPVIVWIGLAGLLIDLVSVFVRLVVPTPESVTVLGSISALLMGVWLIALGVFAPMLPKPLPRWAILGGVGVLMLGADLLLNPGLSMTPLLAVGAVLMLFGLAFVVRLSRPWRGGARV